jgi:hypothetical protein
MPTGAGRRLQSSSGLTIMFSKLVTMAVNRSRLLRMVFENCNHLIYRATIAAI